METIGFIGLGTMGGNMAARFVDAGYPVYGTSRTLEHAQWVVDHGLRWCDTPRDVAAQADVVLTSLPDDSAVRAVAGGADGLLASLRPGRTWVDLSTISPGTSRDLAAQAVQSGADMLDAPVSGSVPQIREGALTVLVGGDPAAYSRLEPLLGVLGTVHHVGGNGQGLVLKLAINLNLAVQMLAFSEGLALATNGGLDPHLAASVMTSSAIGSPMLKARVPLVLGDVDETWFNLALMRKDVGLALATGKESATRLASAGLAVEVLDAAAEAGMERRDIAALYDYVTSSA